MMNRETRKLSKIPEEVREEVMPFYLDRNIIAVDTNSNRKIEKLTDAKAESIRSGLAVRIRTHRIARPNLLPELKLSIQALISQTVVIYFSRDGATWMSTST